MRSYTDRTSPMSSPFYRMGMLDGYRRLTQRASTDRLFHVEVANTELAYSLYCDGYSAGLDANPMPTYEVTSNWGARGGEVRPLLNTFKSR